MHPCRQDQHIQHAPHTDKENTVEGKMASITVSVNIFAFFLALFISPMQLIFLYIFFCFFLFFQSEVCTFCGYALHCSPTGEKSNLSYPSLRCFLVFSPRQMVLRWRINIRHGSDGEKRNESSLTMTFFDFCSLFVVLFLLHSKQKRIPFVYLLKTKDVRKLWLALL